MARKTFTATPAVSTPSPEEVVAAGKAAKAAAETAELMETKVIPAEPVGVDGMVAALVAQNEALLKRLADLEVSHAAVASTMALPVRASGPREPVVTKTAKGNTRTDY
jgi:hypothetical protein